MSWSFVGNVREAQAVTALPGTPEDGDQIIFMDSLSAPTYSWLLRYVAAKSSNKWVFIGGPPQYAEVVTSEAIASASYLALTTPGPSIVIPVAGDYLVHVGFRRTANTNAIALYMSYDIGATGAVDADAATTSLVSGGDALMSVSRLRKKAGLTAVTLTAKYRGSSASSNTLGDRWMSVEPIAVGG